MLTALRIHNVVLIEKLEIDFRKGLCALTGETGAGKSILLDSLGLAIGARADSALVRKDSDQAQVSATFEIPADHPAYAILRDADITVEQGEDLILRRSLTPDGRSKAYINDNTQRGLKPSGDLIPWNIREQYQDSEFPKLAGGRIVRIATHPTTQKMGYGSKALELLTAFFEKKLLTVD